MKINDYKPCDQNWLIIREGNYYAGTFAEIEVSMPVSSLFNKVFLFRTNKNEVVVLK